MLLSNVTNKMLNIIFFILCRLSGKATTSARLLAAFAVDQFLQMCCPSLFQFVQLMCIIPNSTAVVERSFSTMNLLCSQMRSTFTQTKLTNLMLKYIEGLDLTDEKLEELCEASKTRKH